jgi:predicted RNA binding protein YcfA (HicA-like mRNA interferase family)
MEGVSKRRAQPGREYIYDIHYIITTYLGFVSDRTSGSHVQYKRAEDGSTVGIINPKRVPKSEMLRGSEWKRILAGVFWWVPAEERDALWSVARQTRGKDPSVQPPDRQVPKQVPQKKSAKRSRKWERRR